MAMMAIIRTLATGDSARVPEISFGFGAITMYLLLRVHRPRPRRGLYLGPIVAGVMAGPIAGMAMTLAWLLVHGQTHEMANPMIAGFAGGLLLGPFIAIPLTPIAVAARDWEKGPFDPALFAVSCITVVAGLVASFVHMLAGKEAREDAALLVLGAVGLAYFVVRARRPSRAQPAAPAAGPFRSVEAADAPPRKPRAHRPSIAVLLALFSLGMIPLSHRVMAYRAEHVVVHFGGEPTPVAGLDGSARNLVVDGERACAQRGDGTLVCWGNDVGPILGAGWSNVRTPTPRAGLGKVAKYAIEGERLCVLPELGGRVRCAVGSSEFAERGPANAVDLAMDSQRLFVLTRSGEVWAGERIEGLPRAVQLRVKGERACIIDDAASVHCWAFNAKPKRLAVPGPAERVAVDKLGVTVRTRDAKWWRWRVALVASGAETYDVDEPEPLADAEGLADVITSDWFFARLFENGALRCSPVGSGFDFTQLPAGSVEEAAVSDRIVCAKTRDGVSCWVPGTMKAR